MIKHLKKIIRRYSLSVNKTLPADALVSTSSSVSPVLTTEHLRLREQELYGKDHMAEQRLYEQWVCKETWNLESEALPLFLGIDPELLHTKLETVIDLDKILDELWLHAKQCVEQGLLQVTNRESDPENWQVHPLTAFQWAAVSRISLPDTLGTLMGFVANTVKRTAASEENSVNVATQMSEQSAYFDKDSQKILGMALAILAAFPEQSRSSQGRVNINKLMAIMGEKKEFWIGDEKLSLSDAAIKDLLNKWLNTLP